MAVAGLMFKSPYTERSEHAGTDSDTVATRDSGGREVGVKNILVKKGRPFTTGHHDMYH